MYSGNFPAARKDYWEFPRFSQQCSDSYYFCTTRYLLLMKYGLFDKLTWCLGSRMLVQYSLWIGYLLEKKCSENKCVTTEAVARRCSSKKMFLKLSQNSSETTCAGVFLIKLQAPGLQLYQKETSAQEVSYEFCHIFKNIFWTGHYRATVL